MADLAGPPGQNGLTCVSGVGLLSARAVACVFHLHCVHSHDGERVPSSKREGSPAAQTLCKPVLASCVPNVACSRLHLQVGFAVKNL